MNFPRYVALVNGENRTALRRDGDGNGYYRHAGNWSIEANMVDGKMVAVGEGQMAHASGMSLVEITREEWTKDNEGYV